jgi:transcriptional regulator with XRE-family HTH domain
VNITAGFKIVMVRYGYSSNDLAKKLGVSNRAINKAIGSQSIKKIEVIMRYCEAIGCSMTELMDEAEKATASQRKPTIEELCNKFNITLGVEE